MDASVLAFICFALGCVVYNLISYLSKLASGEVTSFDAKFAASMFLSIIMSVAFAATSFASYPLPPDVPTGYLIAGAFSAGMSLNFATNKGLTTYQNIQSSKQTPPPPPPG